MLTLTHGEQVQWGAVFTFALIFEGMEGTIRT